MKTNKKNLKVFMLSLGLATGLLLPVAAMAQAEGGGVFGKGAIPDAEPQRGMFGNSLQSGYNVSTEQFGNGTNGTYNIGTEQFGQNAPLGSGLFIMAAAGAAYALKKRKKNN